jgi:Fe-S-cluster containining protein
MPETLRVTLKDLPSGKIELVLLNGVLPLLQFNCACEHALPYCMAACCRMRSGVNAELTSEETTRLLCHVTGTGIVVLDGKPEDDSCVYLDSKSHLCNIQETKPFQCRTWHCSPNGQGENITKKDNGWFLSPVGALARASV